MLERNGYLGGCIKTAEITLPGFKHDVLSGFHPLFVTSPNYAELADDLARHGLEYLNTNKPTASVTSSHQACVLTTCRETNVRAFNLLASGDGDRYAKTMREMEGDAEFTFALLGSELLRMKMLWLLIKQLRLRKLTGLLDFRRSSNAIQPRLVVSEISLIRSPSAISAVDIAHRTRSRGEFFWRDESTDCL